MAKINQNVQKYKDRFNKKELLLVMKILLDDGQKLREFIHLFDGVVDSRIKAKCKYSTKFIVVITFLAILDIRETWQEIADFAEDKKDFLSKFIEYPDTLPVHDTYMRVFAKINSESLEKVIVSFLSECINKVVKENIEKNPEDFDHLAIDGKALRLSGRKYNYEDKVPNCQLMHFFDVSNQQCIKSVVISEKTNEIPIAQQILPTLDIKNKIVTADAMNCQKKTVEVIINGKGHYVLAIKGNHSEFHQDIESHFKDKLDPIKDTKDYYKMEIEKNHNQVETREFFRVAADSFYQQDDWLNLKSIVCYKKKIYHTLSGKNSCEYRYFISDLKDTKLIALAIRGHWSIENQLHYPLDVFFHEDANRTMNKAANNNFSILRKMVNSLLVLIAPMFRNGSKMRTLKSFRSNYEKNLIRLFVFLEGLDLNTLFKSDNKQ